NPFARGFRRVHRAFVPAAARSLIVEDARRDDLITGAALLLLDRELMGGERNAAHSRHDVRQPELVWIFRVGVLGLPARVRVNVNEPGQYVHPGGVNLVVGVLRLAILTLRQTGRAGAANTVDPVVFDDDVHGALRRRAGSINQDGAADDQSLEWPPALVRCAIWRGVDWRRWLLRPSADQ